MIWSGENSRVHSRTTSAINFQAQSRNASIAVDMNSITTELPVMQVKAASPVVDANLPHRTGRKFVSRAQFELGNDDEEPAFLEKAQNGNHSSSSMSGQVSRTSVPSSRDSSQPRTSEIPEASNPNQLFLTQETRTLDPNSGQSVTLEVEQSADPDAILQMPPSIFRKQRVSSALSIISIVGAKTDFALQKVDPDFTDSRGEYYKTFEKALERLNGGKSENQLCIEEYLVKSERQWYNQFKAAKLGLHNNHSSTSSSFFKEKLRYSGIIKSAAVSVTTAASGRGADQDQWLLGDDYEPPAGLKLFMQYRIGDWPVYTLFLAFGQIVAANSYQITLISGTVGQTAEKLYITATIYLVTSALWWSLFRSVKSVFVLSTPFLFYSLAFLFLGVAPYAQTMSGRGWIQNIATGMYATASSSGSLFFALNFGDEGGAPVKSWVFRACIIQGTQQIYVVALWAWGDYLSSQTASGNLNPSIITTSSTTMTAIALPISALFFTAGLLVYFGLPNYYRQQPGNVPSFYAAIFRRKIMVWFLTVVLIQNFFLSASTGRNWQYLWSSQHAAIWQIACLTILFFIFIWTAILLLFGRLSKYHSWILPIFAIGLGAPRWAQIFWSCSGIGTYLPWSGSGIASALISRSIWLWLGTLDALQGVGFGMILLQTLTRQHIACALIAAQVLGSVATIVARACAPNKLGPGNLFPDFSRGPFPGVGQAWFWIGLVAQVFVCMGFFRFFRKEQLSKP
jgi:alpha-1,3-glucan synthase